MGNGDHNPGFIQNRRPYTAYQPPGLFMCLTQHGYRRVQRFRRLFRHDVLLIGIGLELHDGPCQLLGQTIMDFVGNHLPFVVAGLEQVFEGTVLLSQRFVSLLAFGDVANNCNDGFWLALSIPNHGRGCLGGNHLAIRAKYRTLGASTNPLFHQSRNILLQPTTVVLHGVIEHALTN